MESGPDQETTDPLEISLREAEFTRGELEKRLFHLKTLYDVSQGIGFLKGTDDIMKNLLLMVMGAFGALSGVVLLADNKNGSVEAFNQRGMDQDSKDPLFKAFKAGFLDDSKRMAGVQGHDGPEKRDAPGEGDIVDLLFSLGIHIWVPFQVNEDLKGGIGLGQKLVGDAYLPDDEELLNTLSNQGAVAIQNAELLEQMKKEEIVRTNFCRYLSPYIVDQVIKNDVQIHLGGARKVVTVLFSDIREFTAITEKQPPDRLVHILNEYFTEMAKIIFDNQGSLDKFIGDAMVAVFGSLIAVENPPLNALKTAIRMMERLPELNTRWMKDYDFCMDIGIGITTGEVFLGNIGSPERMEFTVIGDTVNVASRFSGLAKAGQILITRETFDRLGDGFVYKEHPPSLVKGKSERIDVIEVLY